MGGGLKLELNKLCNLYLISLMGVNISLNRLYRVWINYIG